MPTPLSNERTLLTYPTPTITRPLVYLSISILSYSYIRWAPESWRTASGQLPDAHGATPAAWWFMLAIVSVFVFFFLAIGDGLFVIGRKIKKLKLEYDAVNLYVTKGDEERMVPLKQIVSLRLVYGKNIFDSCRSSLYRYAIGFGNPDDPEEVIFTVFLKTRRKFARFCRLVEQENPAVSEKNWATSFDGLIGFFSRKNS